MALRQQAADEKQRAETQVRNDENHAERYKKHMQEKDQRDRDATFKRLANY